MKTKCLHCKKETEGFEKEYLNKKGKPEYVMACKECRKPYEVRI